MKYLIHLVSMLLVVFQAFSARSQPYQADLLIIGGRASGTMAGIQAARIGINTLLIEETEWPGGGMLTSVGVSAVDGNHQLPSGGPLTVNFLAEVLKVLNMDADYSKIAADWERFGFDQSLRKEFQLNRRTASVLLDRYLNPFARPVDFQGRITRPQSSKLHE